MLLRLFFFTCHEHNKDSKKLEMHESIRIQFKNKNKKIYSSPLFNKRIEWKEEGKKKLR